MMSYETFHHQRCGPGGGNGSNIIQPNSSAYRNDESISIDDDSDSTMGQILGQTNSRSFNNDNDEHDTRSHDYDDDNHDGKATGDNHSILSSDFSSFSVSPLLGEHSDNYEQSSNLKCCSNIKTSTTNDDDNNNKKKKGNKTRSQEGTVDLILSSLLEKASIDQPFDSLKFSQSNSSTQYNYDDSDKSYFGPVDLDELVDDLVKKKNDLYTGPVDLDDLVDDMMFVDRTSVEGQKLMDGCGSRFDGEASVNDDLGDDNDGDDGAYRGPVDIDELFEGDESFKVYGDGPVHQEIGMDRTTNDECKKFFIPIDKKAEISTTEDPNYEVAYDEEKVGSNDDTHDEINDEEGSNGGGKISNKKYSDDSLDRVESLIARNHSPDIADDVMDYLRSLIEQEKNNMKITCDRILKTLKSQSFESHLRSIVEDDTMKNKSIPRTVHILSPTITTDSSSSSSSKSHSTPTYSPPRQTIARPAPPFRSCESSRPVDLDTTLELDTEFESILDVFEVQQWKSRDDNAELRNPFPEYDVDDEGGEGEEEHDEYQKNGNSFEKESNCRGLVKM